MRRAPHPLTGRPRPDTSRPVWRDLTDLLAEAVREDMRAWGAAG